MAGLERGTIGGFNSMLQRQKKQAGQAMVTTVLFDERYELIHDRCPIQKVKPLTAKEYYARGCTALLDAVGRTIHNVGSRQKYLPERARAEKVIFVITTDGLENASREYTYERIREMIGRQKEKYGWDFIFLGANMDAVAEGGRFGIAPDRSVTFENDSRGVELNYQVVSETLSCMRMAPSCAAVGAEWKQKIEEDHQKRGKREKRLFGGRSS